MKKIVLNKGIYKITILILILIILLGVYIVKDSFKKQNKNNLISEKNISLEEENTLFAKKKECAAYKNQIMEDILTPNLVYNDSDPELTQIFYSPKRNSCLYVFEYYKSPSCLEVDSVDYFKYGCQFKNQEIVDFLTKEMIYTIEDYDRCLDRAESNDDFDSSECKSVYQKVDELKDN